ncbi:MAG: T9SS type A sorting domain-containing protein [bacterium]|nr:T9SS type A sorting domain-containing protein [bacterium]
MTPFIHIIFQTAHAATITSAGNGAWNSTTVNAPWPGGVVPLATDNVIISNGNTINLSSNQTIVNVTMNGTGVLNLGTNTRTLTVSGNFTMNGSSNIQGNATNRGIAVAGNFVVSSGASVIIQNIVLSVTGTFQNDGTIVLNTANTAGKFFGNFLNNGVWTNSGNNVPFTVGGDFTNNGTFTQGTGRVTFTGATSNVLGGSAASTAFGGGITINKGVAQANVLDVTSVITILAGGLTITNGTFKLSSASTIVPFTADPNMPNTGRLWNNGGTINSTANIDWTVLGTIRVDAGITNFGTSINNRLIPADATNIGLVEINGGTLTVSGRISTGVNAWEYKMTGGWCLLCTVGSNTGGRDIFNLDNSTGGIFSMSGGTLNIVNKGGGAGENLGYHNTSILGAGFTGGVLQMGNSTTAGASTIRIESFRPIYNLVINAPTSFIQVQSPAAPSATTELQITNSVTIVDGTFDISNQNILVGGNWTNLSAVADPLTQGTKSVTFNGSSAQTFANSGPANAGIFYNLVFNNSSGSIPQITLNNNLSATNGLTLTAGGIDINSTILSLGLSAAAPGTLLRTAGWLYGGTFTRWFATPILAIGNVAGLFPMGTSVGDYRPLWVANSVILTTGGQVSVVHSPTYPATWVAASHNDASWGNTLQGVSNSLWTITTSGIDFNGSSAQVRYGGDGFGINTLTDLNASLLASVVGTHGAATNAIATYEVNRTALTTAQIANSWRIGSRNVVQSPLPISLSSFTAKLLDNQVKLDWITETETNNDFFTVERSKDCINFEVLAVLEGAGTSNSRNYYSASDTKPFFGIDYYRLKQTDYDGSSKYHKIVAVKFEKMLETLLVYPNPAKGLVSLQMSDNGSAVSLTEVFNSLGQKVYSVKGFESGIDLSGQPAGIYYLNVHLPYQVITQKLALEN